MIKREKLLILIIYNESIFSANNWEKNIWKEKKKSFLQPKKKKKRIIVFEFFISIKKLHISNSIPNYQLFQNKDWLFNKNQNPCHYSTELFEYN